MTRKSKKPETLDPLLSHGINIAALFLVVVTLVAGAASQNNSDPLLNGVTAISPPKLFPRRLVSMKDYQKAEDEEICPVIKIVQVKYEQESESFVFELEMRSLQATTLQVKNFVLSNEKGLIRGSPSTYLYDGFQLPTNQRNKFIFHFRLNNSDSDQETIFSNVSLSVIDKNNKELCTVDLRLSISLYEHRLSFLTKYFARPIRILIIGNQGAGKTSLSNTLLTCFVSNDKIIITSGQVGIEGSGVATTVKVAKLGEDTMPNNARDFLSPLVGSFQFLDTVGFTQENEMHRQLYDILASGVFPIGWNQIDDPFVGRGATISSEKPDVIILCVPYSSANNAEIKNMFNHIGRNVSLAANRHQVPLFLGVTMGDELLTKSESEVNELLSEAKRLFGNVLLLDTYRVDDTKRRFITDLRSQDVLIALSQKVDFNRLEATAPQKTRREL